MPNIHFTCFLIFKCFCQNCCGDGGGGPDVVGGGRGPDVVGGGEGSWCNIRVVLLYLCANNDPAIFGDCNVTTIQYPSVMKQ